MRKAKGRKRNYKANPFYFDIGNGNQQQRVFSRGKFSFRPIQIPPAAVAIATALPRTIFPHLSMY